MADELKLPASAISNDFLSKLELLYIQNYGLDFFIKISFPILLYVDGFFINLWRKMFFALRAS